MSRRIIMFVGILLSGIVLISCHGQSKQNLLTGQQGKAEETGITEETGKTEEREKTDEPEQTEDTDEPEQTEQTKPTVTNAADVTKPSINITVEDDSMEISGQEISEQFYYEELSDKIIDRITGKSYKENCDVPYEDLRYVTVLYYGFDGETHRGELIVNRLIAKDIVDIFKELYDQQYAIERMELIDEYEADDNVSMAADNTSSFNYRKVDGTDHLSLHSYGLAIDINPLYNPYIRTIAGKEVVTPDNGAEYANRTLDCSYYIDTEDICYQAFTKRGFTWGGAWKNSKDYQHFQKKPE